MTAWHLINNDGDIVRTVTASSRADAVALLGRGGTVVSALSWKLDYHRWQPVRTVVTDVIQPKEKKPYQLFEDTKPGYLRVTEIAKQLDAREGKIRRIIDKHGIPHEIVRQKGRAVQTYSPRSVARIKKYLDALPETITRGSVIEKRRRAFLERMRQYYLAGIHSRKDRSKL